MTTADWTAAELAALFRARAAYLGGYLDDFDTHDAHDGTRDMCHLVDHALALPLAPPRAGSVLRALRGLV